MPTETRAVTLQKRAGRPCTSQRPHAASRPWPRPPWPSPRSACASRAVRGPRALPRRPRRQSGGKDTFNDNDQKALVAEVFGECRDFWKCRASRGSRRGQGREAPMRMAILSRSTSTSSSSMPCCSPRSASRTCSIVIPEDLTARMSSTSCCPRRSSASRFLRAFSRLSASIAAGSSDTPECVNLRKSP
jgi:hypothetical protein